MLSELYSYVTTPASVEAKQLGYLYESIATAARAKRCKQAWRQHLTNTQNAISDAINTYYAQGIRNIAILGGGMTHDLPIDLLINGSKRITVTLIDIVFTKQTIKLCKKHHHVLTSVEHDISGISRGLLACDHHSALPSPRFSLPDFINIEETLVISANLLSQLPYLPLKWLEQQGIAKEIRTHYAQEIIRSHLTGLTQLPHALLITDTHAEQYSPAEAAPITSHDLLYGVKLPESYQHWEWEISPYGEKEKNRRYVHSISCCKV